MKKKKRGKKRIVFVSIITLLILLIILINFQYNLLGNLLEGTEKIVVKEECSLILNNLVHKVTDESGCKTICQYECEISEKRFIESEFKENVGECNDCICYCR